MTDMLPLPDEAPNIDAYPDACIRLDDGSPLFLPERGELVIVERRASMLKGYPWLDTRLVKVVDVDETTGRVELLDAEEQQFIVLNFITLVERGDASGTRVKVAPDVKNFKLPQSQKKLAKMRELLRKEQDGTLE